MGQPLVPGAHASEEDAGKGTRTVMMADELVTRARQTGARTIFIETAALLAGVGGVAATLRYRLGKQ